MLSREPLEFREWRKRHFLAKLAHIPRRIEKPVKLARHIDSGAVFRALIFAVAVPRIVTHAGDVSVARPDIFKLRLRDSRATDLRWIVKVGAKECQQVLAISLRVDILRVPASPQFGRARFDVGGATGERDRGRYDKQRQCSLSPTRHSLDPRFRATIIAGGGAASEGHALSAERMYADAHR